jgi:hypothetical protein
VPGTEPGDDQVRVGLPLEHERPRREQQVQALGQDLLAEEQHDAVLARAQLPE